MKDRKWVPVAEAAVRARVSRERLVRAIQRGILEGRISEDGRYFVATDALSRFVCSRQVSETVPAPAA